MQLKASPYTLLTCFLITSLFLGSFIFQYAALLVTSLVLFIKRRGQFQSNYAIQIAAIITVLAIVSYIYNNYTGLADAYSILFWFVGYLPNFLLIIVTLSLKPRISFQQIYKYYKLLVVFQSILCISAVFQHGKFIVGDPATGTLGDANFLAFHFCVVLLYEVTSFLSNLQDSTTTGRRKVLKVLEILYWLIILLIPESTANLGFVLITISLFFFFEIFIKKFSPAKLILLALTGLSFLIIFINSFVFVRFQEVYNILDMDKPALQHPYFNKFVVYKKVFTGEIYEDVNPLIGSGPSTFTSRSSIIRMPELRYNSPPFEVPYFKNDVVDMHVSKIIKNALESSYGNFGSPQTTVVSVLVELGVLGFFLFSFLFYKISTQISKEKKLVPHKKDKLNFLMYFTVFFILNLFFLNMWEYPIYSFTYFLFVFLIL